ncbi:MAG: lysophospholipid acyltransferase family protein [Janthinobacterium lividum]
MPPEPDARADAPLAALERTRRRTLLCLHVALGGIVGVTVFRFFGPAARQRIIKGWSQRLLSLCGVRLVVHDHSTAAITGGALLVSNHVSWIDIYVIDAWRPTPFIAKAEIARWPVIGMLAKLIGTIFIEREKRGDARRIAEQLSQRLSGGGQVVLFPEGTTSDGVDLLPFHASLFEGAVQAGAPVQPLCLLYEDALGRQSLAPAFVGDLTLFDTLTALLRQRPVTAHLYLGKPIAPGLPRRALTAQAELAVQAALQTLQASVAPAPAEQLAALRANVSGSGADFVRQLRSRAARTEAARSVAAEPVDRAE